MLNEREQLKIKEQVNSGVHSYKSVLDKMLNDDWINLNSRQQTMSRMKRKGKRALADQISRLDEDLPMQSAEPETEIVKESAPSASFSAAPPTQGEELRNKVNRETKEAIHGKDNMIASRFLHEGSDIAHSVCRIVTYPDREAKGTGFMISPRVMMTNQHVIASAADAKGYILEFDYYTNDDGEKIEASSFFLAPEELFVKSDQDELDYAVIAVQEVNEQGENISNFGWNKLIEERGKIQIGEHVNIIHHPGGDPQKISIRQNYLMKLDDSNRLDYMSDTMEGSSGAPVYNEEWEVVGLHRASDEMKDEKVIAMFLQLVHNVDADLARQMEKKAVKVNLGIRISVIVNSLRIQLNSLDNHAQGLLQQVFDINEWQGFEKNRMQEGRLPSQGSAQLESTTTKAKIADQINISGGSVQFFQNDKAEYTSPQITKNQNGAKENINPELYDNDASSKENVITALAFLQSAREKEYLPPAAEIERRKNEYYTSIISNVDELSKSEFYDALHSQLSTTLSLASTYPDILQLNSAFGTLSLEGGGVSYDRARAHLYTWVDLYPDRVLRCVYTKAIIAPEQLLLKDLITKLGLRTELPQRYKNNQYLNCEHIVPQSWFNKEKKGVSDLHHLITADGATNNFRSDGWYTELEGQGNEGPSNLPEYISPGGIRSDDTDFFEPKNNKALVARATLYFIVAHRGKMTIKNYDADQIKTLIAWAKSDVPNEYELHRNEAIFEIQGNRNPFIDFPEWLDKVDFLRGM